MSQKQDFPLWVKTRLWQRDRMSVGRLARELGKHRSTVSTAIHHPEKFPKVNKSIVTHLSK